MLIVTGSATARPDTVDRLRQASLDHVHRSRTEAGCISHAVFVDCEDPLRLFFFERWADQAALQTHFEQPGSVAFVRALRELAAASTGPDVYDSTPLPR